uniref:RNA-directed RNA polymerase C-terminal domain-containing protein n=1 Tax=Suncus murinus ribovirus 5 TaxID=3139579 RepID=A0AB38ZKB8_9VIRU
MEKAYAKTVWILPDDFDSYRVFRKILFRLEMTSSPGYPYNSIGPTNRDVLKFNGVTFDEVRVASLWFDVQKLLSLEKNDLILRVFIKPEPHKLAKLQENRLRLIMACPLNYQIVWHMLFDYQNDLEIAQSYNIPSQQGIVLPLGGWKNYLRQWKAKGFDTGLDKSAWDWTAPYWALNLDLEFRKRMGRGRRMDDWNKLAGVMYKRMFHRAFLLLSDGRVFRQIHPGIMKSGCVNTISTNSHMQVMIHILACEDQNVDYEPLPACCGDDTLQKLSQAVDLSCYARYGAIVKSASADIEFVGHEFTRAGPIPLYHGKHVSKFMTVPDDILPEYLDSMCRLYCKNGVVFYFWMRMAEKLGLLNKLKSREYYQDWYDYQM